jgi:branched-chain amino acid transport system substrate-binding protein
VAKTVWRRARSVLILVSALLIGLLPPGCERAKRPVNIGVDLELSGPLAQYGKWSKQAMEIALDDVNAAGGIRGRRVELLIEDNQSTPNGAVAAFNKLVTVHKVPVIIGFIGSSQAMACAPIAERTKTVLFSTAAATPALTQAGDYVFRCRVNGVLEVSEMARFAYRELGIRTLGIIHVNTDYGTSYRDILVREFERLGGKVVDVEAYNQGATDVRSQLAKLNNAHPQAVYMVGHITECGYVLKQARELGVHTRWLSANAIEGPQVVQIAGRAANGVIYSAPRYDPSDRQARHFDQEYYRRFGEHSEMFGAHAYDAVMLAAKAIQEGGYTADGIRAALHRVRDYAGVSGETTFDRNGDVVKPIWFKTIRNGRFVPYQGAGLE